MHQTRYTPTYTYIYVSYKERHAEGKRVILSRHEKVTLAEEGYLTVVLGFELIRSDPNYS